MKRLLLTGLLQLFVIFAFSQDEMYEGHMNMVDKEGRKQGVWKLYDDYGNLKFSGEYINGKPVGPQKFYYPNGKMKALVTHSADGAITHSRNFYDNGVPMAYGRYVNQKKDSIWVYYSQEDTSLSAEEFYSNGLKEGVSKTFYPDGQVYEELTYKHDIKDGPWTQYFTDGKIKTKATYVNNMLVGQFTVYHLNGMVEISGTYKNNEKDGTWVYMKDTGEMEKKEEWKEGVLISKEPEEEQK